MLQQTYRKEKSWIADNVTVFHCFRFVRGSDHRAHVKRLFNLEMRVLQCSGFVQAGAQNGSTAISGLCRIICTGCNLFSLKSEKLQGVVRIDPPVFL